MPVSDGDFKAVLAAETNELKVLAKLIGLDPGQDFRGLCLSGADLSGQDLAGFDFSNADLCNANFTGANLTGTLFDHASLCKVNFRAANLRDALFLYGDCTGSNFHEACLDNTFFIGCELAGIEGELRPVLLINSCPPPIYPTAVVEALAEALQDPNQVVRGLAAVALGRIDSPEAARSALPILIDEIRGGCGSDDMVRSDLVQKMADEFEASAAAVLETVSRSASQVQSSARSLTEMAKFTGDGAVNLAASADQTIINVQTVSTAAEQLSASIAEIALKAEQSSQASQAASEEAGYTNEIVERLAETATRIGDVVKLIDDIASQTNLLAMNATVEAARAGEAGKGFAVVAKEVKKLASQTARATGEIADQIQSVQNATKEAVDAMTGISTTIGRIRGINSSIAAVVAEQDAATREIARNILLAAEGTSEVAASIGEVTRVSVESRNVANHVLDSAYSLARGTSGLQDAVSAFLKAIRQD